MSIEEKAKEFAGYNISFPGVPTIAEMDSRYDGFKAGAEWMFEKAVNWLKENAQNYYKNSSIHDNCWYDDEQMIEDLQKAMKE